MTLDWNTDWWDVKAPRVHAPEPKARVPKPVPEPERLFTIQRHMLDTLHLLRELDVDDHHAKKLIRQIESQVENTYKIINTYLKTNVAPSQGGGY